MATNKPYEIRSGNPSNSEGSNGEVQVRWIGGQGLYIFVKYNNKWYSQRLNDKALTLSDEIQSSSSHVNVQSFTQLNATRAIISKKFDMTGEGSSFSIPGASISYANLRSDANSLKVKDADVTQADAGLAGSNGYLEIKGTSSEIDVDLTDLGGDAASFQVGLPSDVVISGDLTIGGDLTFGGDTSNTLDSVSLGTFTITQSDSEAFKVENNAGTDLFILDTQSGEALLTWNAPKLFIKDVPGTSGSKVLGIEVDNDVASFAKTDNTLNITDRVLNIDLVNSLVGIGTTTPDSKLTIDGNATADSSVSLIKLHSTEDDSDGSVLNITGATNTASGSRNISIQSYSGTSSAVNNLSLNPSGGNVGIGTASPTHSLHVQGDDPTIRAQATGNNDAPLSVVNDTKHYQFRLTGSDSSLRLFDVSAATHRLIISTDGKVGIADTNPSETLSVTGNISASPSSGTGKAAIIASSSDQPQLSLVSGTATEKMDLRANTDATKTWIDLQPTTGLNRAKWVYFGSDSDKVNFGVSDLNTSVFTGTGWGIRNDGTTSSFYIDDLYVRGKMTVFELVINSIRATNGSLVVTSAAKIETTTNNAGTYTVNTYIEATMEGEASDNHPFANNDLIMGKSVNPATGSSFEVKGTVTDASWGNANQFKFQINIGSGNTADIVGMTFVRIGNTSDADRQGGLYLTSDDANAPFIDIWDDVDEWADWAQSGTVRARVGRLDGVSGATNEFGLMAGEGFNASTHSFIKASNLGVSLYNAPIELNKGSTRKIVISPGTGTTGGSDSSFPYIAIGSDVADGTWSGGDAGILFTQADDGTVVFDMGKANGNYISYQSNTGAVRVKGSIEIVEGGWSDPDDVTGINNAVSQSQSAYNTANAASDTANSASSTASAASTAATNAQNTANTAASDASSAVSTANAASNAANDAQSTANTAAQNISTLNSSVANLTSELSNTSLSDLAADAPTSAGLYMDATKLGYSDGSNWKTYMNSSGGFYLSGSGNDGLSWDGQNLRIGNMGFGPSVNHTFDASPLPGWMGATYHQIEWRDPDDMRMYGTGESGFQIYNNNDAWDNGWACDAAFKRSDSPVFCWDIVCYNGYPATMLGIQPHGNGTSTHFNVGGASYVYFQGGVVQIRYYNDQAVATIANVWQENTPTRFRVVCTVRAAGGAHYKVYKEGNFTTPILSHTITYGTDEYIQPHVCTHYHGHDGSVIFTGFSAGNGTPPLTSISGDSIKTGAIRSNNYDQGSSFANKGTLIDLVNGSIYAEQFKIGSDGTANFKGDITGASGTFSGTVQIGGTALTENNTLNTNVDYNDVNGTPTIPTNTNQLTDGANLGSTANWGNVSGNGKPADNATNTNPPESADHSSGSVGGWVIDSNSIYSGTKEWNSYTTGGITITSYNGGSIHTKNFYVNSSGDAFFKGNGEFTGEVTATSGTFSGTVNAAGGNFSGNIYTGQSLIVNGWKGRIRFNSDTYYNTLIGEDVANTWTNPNGASTGSSVSSSENVMIGMAAGRYSAYSQSNVFVGKHAGAYAGRWGSSRFDNQDNVAIGTNAMRGVSLVTVPLPSFEPWGNICIGQSVGSNMGRWSTAPSYVEGGTNNTHVSHGINVLIGAQIGQQVSSGANVAIGAGAFQNHRYPDSGRTESFNSWTNAMLGFNVAIGYGSSFTPKYQSTCTTVGAWSEAGYADAGIENAGAFGHAAGVYQNNHYRIGNLNTRLHIGELDSKANILDDYKPVATFNQQTTSAEAGNSVTEVLLLYTGDNNPDTTNNRFITFRQANGEAIGAITGGVSYGTFTGSHVSQNPYYTNEELRSKFKQGLIVHSIGELMQEEGESSIDKAWPFVDICSKKKDSSVMGVVASLGENPAKDSFADSMVDMDLITYNALGEGMILVTDTNGNIETGDYICSSEKEGLGEKQDDDILHNYTVAKATIPCDFSDVEVDPEFGCKVKLIACTYHCG